MGLYRKLAILVPIVPDFMEHRIENILSFDGAE